MRQKLSKPLTRRQMLAVLGASAAAPAAGASWGFGVEPRWPEAVSVRLGLSGFPRPVKTVLVSDPHMGPSGGCSHKAADMIRAFSPEMLFVTGDLVTDGEHLPLCLRWLSQFSPPLGAWFVPGNWEHRNATLKYGLVDKLSAVGVRSLVNRGVEVETGAGAFFLAGVDDLVEGEGDINRAWSFRRRDLCTILLSHSPVAVQYVKKRRCDLILAGHTHGGQVRLPLVGALATPPGSAGLEMGLYTFSHTRVYVNRGLGTSVFPLRFLCRPEVTLLTLEPSPPA
ncbi:MAG: metallophosphoesterase [Deltaproteobacteria bacterium]|nr:metallophosphoesterase [Deltaproteobacteria bacterium]